jgi:YVTN family beta-propeller protein
LPRARSATAVPTIETMTDPYSRRRFALLRTVLAAAAVSFTLACHRSTFSCADGGIGTGSTSRIANDDRPFEPRVATVAGLRGRPFGVAVSPSGTVYVTQQDANSVACLTLTTEGSTGASIPVSQDPGDVIFNRAGTVAYVSTFYGNIVHFIDVASGRQTAAIPFGQNAYRLALSADESRLFVTSVTGTLSSVSTIRPTAPVTSVYLGGSLQGIALSKSGTTLFVTASDGRIVRLDPATLQVLGSARVGGSLQDVAVSTDGSELYVADEMGAVVVVDAVTLATKTAIEAPRGAFGLELTPDGRRIYVASTNGELVVFDRTSRNVLARVNLGGTPRRIAFDATGTTAVIANEGDWVNIVR